MNIIIERIIEKRIVEISSHVGSAITLCLNDDLIVAKTYGAEFNINEFIVLYKNAQKVDDKAFFIRHNGLMTELQGLSEGIDESGILWFRLATDCLLALESDDKSIHEGDQLLIQVPAEQFEIFIIGR